MNFTSLKSLFGVGVIEWRLKKIFLMTIVLIIVGVLMFEAIAQLLPENISPIVNQISSQYAKQNVYFNFIPICDIPQEVFDTCHLPLLTTGHILQVKDIGIVWCSSNFRDSCGLQDSCYIVVKTKYSYNIEWWKRFANKWFYSRTQHFYKKSK
jgi:hypothetical protein